MSNTLNWIKNRFQISNNLLRLLYINIGLFLIVKIVMLIFTLFNTDGTSWVKWLELPSNIYTLLIQPWTLITYMFMHLDFFHLFFNMLCLYWFGQIFINFFNQKQLVAVYLLGGLAGALLYILSYNLFPFFNQRVGASYLIGASASVMAIMVAIAVKAPNFPVRLLFIGNVKLKYLAIIMVAVSFFGITSSNAGGEFSHLGGALFGYLYALALNKGHDWSKPVTAVINALIKFGQRIKDLFTPKTRFKVKHNKNTADEDYNKKKADNNREVDIILDKIKKSGYSSLSADEKQRLFDKSKNL